MRVVVRGAGSIGMRHARVLRELGYSVWLFPARTERVKELESSGWQCLGSWSLAEKLRLTHAVIATDSASHPREALMALQAGLNVLVEKPIGISLAELEPLLSLSLDEQARVKCGMTLRFSLALINFSDRLREVGRVHGVAVECRSWLPGWRPQSDYRMSYSASAGQGGVLRDLIHEVDYVTWLFGWPKDLDARLINLNRIGIESEECALIQYQVPCGAGVQVTLDYLTKNPVRRISAYGDQGSICCDLIAQTVAFCAADGQEMTERYSQDRDTMFSEELRTFMENGEGVSLKDAARAVAVCDAARQSSGSGNRAAVAYPCQP